MSYESDMKELPVRASKDFIEANIADTYNRVKQEDANQDNFDRYTIRYELISEQNDYAKKIADELEIGEVPYDQLDDLIKAQAAYIEQLKAVATKWGLL